MVRDAVKRALPKDVPKPGKFRLAEAAETKSEAKPDAAQAPAAPAATEGA
jgi:large subunit ribosomal protein L3